MGCAVWAVLLVLLADLDFGSSSCSRWNCPCTGDAEKRSGVQSKRWYPHYHTDADNARRRTKTIMEKMVDDRFRDDDHIQLLMHCSDNRGRECTQVHFQNNCTLEGLPTLPHIDWLGRQDFASHPSGVMNFAQQSRFLLSKLAVFVDQARKDEEQFMSNRHHSLADDIRLLEEQHLYHILCNLHVDFSRKQISWNPSISRGLMQLGCRLLDDRAPIDNRNFIIFYTLERLLQNIAEQFQRVIKRHGREAFDKITTTKKSHILSLLG